MEPNHPFVKFLRAMGAARIAHSGRDLLSHLCGTYDLLKSSGEREAVCVGGLFHSVYGTNAFDQVLIHPHYRPAVRQLIGDEAEGLAYRFCTIDRPWCFLSGDNSDRDLIAIEIANLHEQKATGLAARLSAFAR